MWNMQDFFCETIARFLLDFGVKFNFELIVFPYRNIFNFLFTPSYSLTAWEICPGSFFFSSLQLLHLSCPLPTWTLSSSFSSPPLTSYLTLSSSFLNQAKFFKPLYPRRVFFSPLSSSLSRASDDLTCRVWGLFVIPSLSRRASPPAFGGPPSVSNQTNAVKRAVS